MNQELMQEVEQFMAAVARRIEGARSPGDDEMDGYDGWRAACCTVYDAIMDEISEREKRRSQIHSE